MNISLTIAILESVVIVGLGAMLFVLVRVIHSLENITESLYNTALTLKVNVVRAERQLSTITNRNKQEKTVDVKRKPGRGFIIIEPLLDFPNDRED